MTHVTDDNLGRRLFQIQKEKAVEDALEKIRRIIGADWKAISTADTDILKEILGELWTSIDRPRWGSYSFSKLSKEDITSLIAQGKFIKNKHAMTNEDLNSLDAILSRTI
jgi:hypothetical protein